MRHYSVWEKEKLREKERESTTEREEVKKARRKSIEARLVILVVVHGIASRRAEVNRYGEIKTC